MLFIFTESKTGITYLFNSEEELDKFVKWFGCDYYDSIGTFPVEREDYTVNSIQVMTAEQAIAECKGE